MVESKIAWADLHVHGPIGLQDYWLRKQGYYKQNIFQLIIDQCNRKKLDICAITSEAFHIEKGSVQDRFNFLIDKFPLPRGYQSGKLGENTFIVEADGRRVLFVNGQTVIVKEDGKRFDHLVVGSNQIPNELGFDEVNKHCLDNGVISIGEHIFLGSHFGVGLERAIEYVQNWDAIECNAQLVLPRILGWLPIIGQYSKESNDLVKIFAKTHDRPVVWNSDAHRIEDIGAAHISFDANELNFSDEDNFLQSFRELIRERKFHSQEGYVGIRDWINWTSKFFYGVYLDRKR